MRQRKKESKGYWVFLAMGVLVAMLVLPRASRAEDVKPEVKVSGLIFAHYQFFLGYSQDDTGANLGSSNSFDVSRVYLNADTKLDDKISTGVQLEVNKQSVDQWSSAAVDAAPLLKKAFIKIKDIYPGASLSLGLIGTPWIGFEEGIWKQRFVSKTEADIDGTLNSVDRGVSLSGKYEMVEYDVAIVNGEGRGTDTNKYKDFLGRVTIIPSGVEGLKINFYGQKGDTNNGVLRNRFFGGLSYESAKWNAMGTYYSANGATTGKGYSIHGVYNIDPVKWVFGRMDKWDPDDKTTDDASSRYIIGVGHKIRGILKGALSYQSLNREKESATKKDRGAFYYSLEVKF